MKIYPIASIFFFSLVILRGQNIAPFAPIGTKWTYNFYSYGQGGGYVTKVFTKDTLIAGITCRQLANKVVYTSCDIAVTCLSGEYKEHLFQRNDSLFSIRPTASDTPTIRFIFNYRYRVGDSFQLNGSSQFPSRYFGRIKRSGYTYVNDKRLKFWEINENCNNNYNTNYSTFHFEQILTQTLVSFSNEFYSFCASNRHSVHSLCSYESEGWTYTPQACRTPTQEISENLNIYPSIATQYLVVTSSQFFTAQYKILDLYGRTIQKGSYTEMDNLDVSELPQGLYFLSLYNSEKRSTLRFVKK